MEDIQVDLGVLTQRIDNLSYSGNKTEKLGLKVVKEQLDRFCNMARVVFKIKGVGMCSGGGVEEQLYTDDNGCRVS